MTRAWSTLAATELAAHLPGLPRWPYGTDLCLERIASGTTNVNWRMAAGADTYFLKVPGHGSEAFVDRAVAHEAALVAHSSGVGPAPLYFDAASGVEVTEYLEGYRSSTLSDILAPGGAGELMQVYRRLHDGPLLATTKTLFDMIDEHVAQVAEIGRPLQPYQIEVQQRWRPIQERYIAAGLDLVPGHNDPNPANYMVRQGSPMLLVDYDYAANTDRYYEIGAITTIFGLPEEAQVTLFTEYAGPPSEGQKARLFLSGLGTLVKWGHWALYNSAVRDVDFDYEKYGAGMLLAACTLLRGDRCAAAVAEL